MAGGRWSQALRPDRDRGGESPVPTPKAERKRLTNRPALLRRHEYGGVKDRLDAAEVRIDFLEAQMKATLARYKELAKMLEEKKREPIDDEITRMMYGPDGRLK
jgi:hypothetical protein